MLRQRKQRLIDEFSGEALSITTCDDVVLDAAYFPGAGSAQTSDPTMIFFAANMQLYENPSSRQYLKMYTMAGFNVLLFNYRGVSQSTGVLTASATILDGEAMFQYVTQHLGVAEEHVILHGRSIGGGVSLAVAAQHPTCCVCNERSFQSLYSVIVSLFRALLGVDLYKPTPQDSTKVHLKHCCKVCLVYSVAGLARWIGWDYTSDQNWHRVKGFKWVFFHPQDTIIPLEASLHAAVAHSSVPTHSWRMEGDPTESHNRPLSEEEVNWNLNMMVQAIQSTERNRSSDLEMQSARDDI